MVKTLAELFPILPKLPDGFAYHEGFLTSDEERELHKIIQGIELNTFVFQGYEAKRKVASFGYDYSFEKRTLAKGRAIPSSFHWLITKVAGHLSIPEPSFAELLVTEYPVGSVINWHRDAPPFDLIASISIWSDCTFKLRPHDKDKRSRKSTITFPVRRRSLYIISGVSREAWEHCTAPVNEVRYSITLRTLRQ